MSRAIAEEEFRKGTYLWGGWASGEWKGEKESWKRGVGIYGEARICSNEDRAKSSYRRKIL